MSWIDRLLGRPQAKDVPEGTIDRLVELKELELPIVASWEAGQVAWPALSFSRLRDEGYNTNAAVGACVSAHAFAYPEPRPRALDTKGDPVKDNHPLQLLLNRPNFMMGHTEFMRLISTYKAVGGNCYIHKVRNRAGMVVELWPYHDGHLTPVPGRNTWIESYEYDLGDGNKQRIPADDIIHLKWPLIDLDRPWMGLSPLRQVAREIDSDTEMTRMLYALLRNDATPRTLIIYPAGTSLNDQQKEHLRQVFQGRHGGDNRGGVGFITGGADIKRLALNLEELDMSALRGVPEARICAAFRVPPEVAGLTIGMAHSTENNLAAADVRFTQRTLVPLWKSDANEYTVDLAREFGDYTIEYDLSEVAALQEDQNAKTRRTIEVFEKNGIVVDELREAIGFPPIDDVIPGDTRGKLFAYELKAPAPQIPQPSIIDITPQPAQLTDEGEKALRAAALKVLKRTSTEPIEAQLARELADLYGETWRKVGDGIA